MDTIALVLLLANICRCRTTSEMETYSGNGWRPISNERVFSDYWNSKISSTGWLHSPNNHDFIKVVDAPNINMELMESSNMEPTTNQIEHNQGNIPRTSIVLPINRKVLAVENIVSENLNDNLFRRGKKLELKSNSNSNKIIEEKYDINLKKEGNQEINNNNTYKVIEDTDDEDLSSADQNTFFSKSNYEINEQNKRENNFTDSLLKILSNYNIRTSDKLPNYAISLRQNSRNSNSAGYVYMRVPIRIPLKYNNANHASVDPLLAVFLSNYGHYVPGLFGFQQNYKNLYGYLASNNIHNNKPFGAYKIFADTDSSL